MRGGGGEGGGKAFSVVRVHTFGFKVSDLGFRVYMTIARTVRDSSQVDGVNDTWDATHMWLAPYSRAKPTCIHFVFDEV